MKVSYIIPHRNRVDLFRRNLDSLLAQTDKDFEAIVVDNSDLPFKYALDKTIEEYRAKGLDIKGFAIDPMKCKYSHSHGMYNNNYNPAVSINVGVKQCVGDVIVLTSPEVVNAKTNIEEIKKCFSGAVSRFCLGWMEERASNAIPNLANGITSEQIKQICFAQGNGAKCRPEHWKPVNYFIGAMFKKDFVKIGGIDERYMIGIGFEDDCFAARCEENGFPAELVEEIAGVHLSHPRSYQGNLWKNPNNFIFKNKRALKVANRGENWGSESYIVGTF